MTHAELRRRPGPPGLAPSDCPGEAQLLEGLTDPAETGHPIVDIYRCSGCGHTIAVNHADGRIRNDYADPREWIRELLAHLARRGQVRK